VTAPTTLSGRLTPSSSAFRWPPSLWLAIFFDIGVNLAVSGIGPPRHVGAVRLHRHSVRKNGAMADLTVVKNSASRHLAVFGGVRRPRAVGPSTAGRALRPSCARRNYASHRAPRRRALYSAVAASRRATSAYTPGRFEVGQRFLSSPEPHEVSLASTAAIRFASGNVRLEQGHGNTHNSSRGNGTGERVFEFFLRSRRSTKGGPPAVMAARNRQVYVWHVLLAAGRVAAGQGSRHRHAGGSRSRS